MAKSKSYEEFTEKFKPKKTTDDCYTPPIVYEAVADYVAKEYGLDKGNFVRPFWPGGDYQAFEYTEDAIVVDNPPFSILSQIIRYYTEHGIKYFLFAPALTLFGSAREVNNKTMIPCAVSVIYENGANVSTSFVTNLDDGVLIKSNPELYRIVTEANARNQNEVAGKRELPKYSYPDNVLMVSDVSAYSKYGVDFSIRPNEAFVLGALDSQRKSKKGLFGSGYLISDKKAADKKAADKKAADKKNHIVWELSERELGIIEELNKKSESA